MKLEKTSCWSAHSSWMTESFSSICSSLAAEVVIYTGAVILLDYLAQNVKWRQRMSMSVANRKKEDPINLRERRDGDVTGEEDRVAMLAQDREAKRATGLFTKNLNKTFKYN